MSGHSKWANIKHKKAKADAAKGKAFTKVAREIIVATKSGGPDPDANFRLRMAIQKAKSINMPNESIERAIKKGAGEEALESYEEVIYEGYGPGGVAVLLEIMTDNRNRTASEIRYIFSRNGGNLGESGCVAWMFDQKGLLTISKAENGIKDEDEFMMLALDAGAEDIDIDGDTIEVVTAPGDLESVRNSLVSSGIQISNTELTMIPKNTIEISDVSVAQQVMRLIERLEDNEDVQEVHSNFEISDEILEKLE